MPMARLLLLNLRTIELIAAATWLATRWPVLKTFTINNEITPHHLRIKICRANELDLGEMAKKSDSKDRTVIANQTGLTLAELMVSVAISTVIAAIGTSYTLAALPLFHLKKAARVLYSQMQQARLNAIKDNGQWQIVFPGGGAAAGTYQIVSGGPNRVIGGGDDIVVETVTLANYGSGVTFGAGSAAQTWTNGAITQRPSMTFQTNGSCGLGSTYLTNQSNTISYAITSTLAGSIKMRKYNGTTPFNANNWMD